MRSSILLWDHLEGSWKAKKGIGNGKPLQMKKKKKNFTSTHGASEADWELIIKICERGGGKAIKFRGERSEQTTSCSSAAVA